MTELADQLKQMVIDHDAKLDEVLTNDQHERLKTLLGAPFDIKQLIDPDQLEVQNSPQSTGGTSPIEK
jgi:hypothetical protein